jgi:hypothetical protein
MRKICLLVGAATALSGCVALPGLVASGGGILAENEIRNGFLSQEERRLATFEAIGDADLSIRHIKIKDVEREDGLQSWTAETANGVYNCSVMTGRTDATCSKR